MNKTVFKWVYKHLYKRPLTVWLPLIWTCSYWWWWGWDVGSVCAGRQRGKSKSQLSLFLFCSHMKRILCSTSHPQDEADGGHSRRGHDFGTVGHEVQQRGHDALRPVVKLVTQQWRQMSERGKDMLLRKSFTQKGGEKLNKEDKIWHLLSEEIVKNVLIKTEHLVHLSGGLSERRWHYRGWQDPRRSHRFINLLLFQCISALFHLIRVVLQFRWRMFLLFFFGCGAPEQGSRSLAQVCGKKKIWAGCFGGITLISWRFELMSPPPIKDDPGKGDWSIKL